MIFSELELKGAYIIEPKPLTDERGFFARIFCRQEFAKYALNPCIAQCDISFNRRKGTIRGMHYQITPYQEAKLLSCIKGSIYDVIIDLRKDSATFLKWEAVYLNEKNRQMLYIPEGFAHGFQTLQDNTEIYYQISEYYHPECSRGLRWNDPKLAIPWPLSEKIVSRRDDSFPLLDEMGGLVNE